MEAKSGALVRPLFTAYFEAEAESDVSRPIGDSRPVVFAVRVQPEAKDGLIVFQESNLPETVYALSVQPGLIDG